MADLVPPSRIARVLPGQATLPAESWNRVAAAVEVQLERGVQGVQGIAPGVALECELVADSGTFEGTDWLTVRVLETSEQIEVRRPYLLRPSIVARGGVTYTYSDPQTREATGSVVQTERITEAWIAGDLVLVHPVAIGGGRFIWEADSGGRAWAKE